MGTSSGNVLTLPHAAEAELALLGSVLLDNQALAWLKGRLEPADFYGDPARVTFSAMLELHAGGVAVDVTTLLPRVGQIQSIQAAGGAHFLLGLTDRVPSAANYRHYARIILEKSDLRRAIERLVHATDRAHSGNVEDIGSFLDDIVRDVEGVRERSSARLADHLDELAPTRASAYGLEELASDEQCELLDLSTLPPWPSLRAPEHGHGLGRWLGQRLGGVRPGEVVMIGASTAKAGKTAFLMQLADGLALRTADIVREDKRAPLTPVFVCSEMSSQQLAWRSIARWTGYDSRIYRAGRTAVQLLTESTFHGDTMQARHEVETAFKSAKVALDPGQLFGASREFMRDLKPGTRQQGPALLDHVARLVGAWRRELTRRYDREVWPIVVLDPIQRWQEHGANEIDALNELTEVLNGFCLDEGWIVLLTSDSTKAAATGQHARDGAGLLDQARSSFRGSYKLQHVVSHGIYLHRPEPEEPDLVEAVVAIQRWGSGMPPWPRYRWELKTGRFVAQPPVVLTSDAPANGHSSQEDESCPVAYDL